VNRFDAADGPVVTVILPTHNHAGTVDLAAASVLKQSLRSLELVIIGDGATSDVKAAVVPLLADERVRFIDSPKTPSRAELIRHEVLGRVTSPYVCYLGDDDVMLPDHLATTLDRLKTVDFTHPLPVYVDRDGMLKAHLTDLAEPRCRLWHQHPFRNAVSLTGVGHRVDAYLRLPFGWQETPAGRWSDHYMWQQWFATPGFRYATGNRLTVLKFEGSVRSDMTEAQRRAEIVSWVERSRQPGFDEWLAHQAAEAFRLAAIDLRLALDAQADQFVHQRGELIERGQQWSAELDALGALEAATRAELAEKQAAERGARVRADAMERRAVVAEAEMEAIRATRTWRLRDRLVRFPLLSKLTRR
jgi:hypothetical protein